MSDYAFPASLGSTRVGIVLEARAAVSGPGSCQQDGGQVRGHFLKSPPLLSEIGPSVEISQCPTLPPQRYLTAHDVRMITIEDLSDTERRVWDAFPTGGIVNLLTGRPEDDDPAGGADWEANRQVRAEVLLALLSGSVDSGRGLTGAVKIQGARIIGMVGLPEASFKHSLLLDRCYVGEGIQLSNATTKSVEITSCQVGPIALSDAKVDGRLGFPGSRLNGNGAYALSADGLTVTGRMVCNGITTLGGLLLSNASVSALSFNGSHLDGKDGNALSAVGLRVAGAMTCSEGFRTRGSVLLGYASVGLVLSFSDAYLDGADGNSLVAPRLNVTGDMLCNKLNATGGIVLSNAVVDGILSFEDAHLDGKGRGEALSAASLKVSGHLICNSRFRADGPVGLNYASVGAGLMLNGAHLDGRNENCLMAVKAAVTGDITCTDLTTAGGVALTGASIGGALMLDNAHLDGQGKEALSAAGVKIGGNVIGNAGFRADGLVNISLTMIGGSLSFGDAYLCGNEGDSLTAVRAIVAADMVCGGITTAGGVNLSGVNIGGSLSFQSAHLDGKGGNALTATRLIVTGDMSCAEISVTGGMMLSNASVGGALIMSGAHLDGKGGKALVASALNVAGTLACNQGFRAEGTVELGHASIGGSLSFNGACLDGKGKNALFAVSLRVDGAVMCTGGFKTEGGVVLTFASIGGPLAFNRSSLKNKDAEALSAEALSVSGYLYFTNMEVEGIVNLANAKVGQLSDDKDSWPHDIKLDGLVYESIADISLADRLNWLSRASGYLPQPYEQLAAYYRRLGSDRQARRVLLAKQRAQRRQRPLILRGWGWLQDALVGYGYAPGRALVLLTGAFVGGYLLFRSYKPPSPVDPITHPVFNAALYTLDVLIPAGGLGQASDWAVHGVELLVATGLHILGWLLAIAVIAAITRSISRN